MSPYGCISSGDMQGIIEVVDNAETIGSIFEKSLTSPSSPKGCAYTICIRLSHLFLS
jgi:hypothetical protein